VGSQDTLPSPSGTHTSPVWQTSHVTGDSGALPGCAAGGCQVQVYSGRGSGQVRMKADGGQGQGAGQEVSPAGVDDRLDSMTKDNER